MNKLLKISLVAGISLPTALIAADWTKIQDFNTDYAGFDLTLAVNGSGEMMNPVDPTDASNKTFYVESGNYGVTDYNDTYATIVIPDPVGEGETATFYWRYYAAGPSNSFHVALSDVVKKYDSVAAKWTAPSKWGDMEPVFRMVAGELTLRDATKYPLAGTGADAAAFSVFRPTNGIWYEFWMVARNKAGIFEDDYSVYVKGGEFTDITLLRIQEVDQSTNVPTGNIFDSAYFRNGTTDALVSLVIASGSGPAGSPDAGDLWYMDDLYMVAGQVLEAPVSGGGSEYGKWGPWDIADAAGNVDTTPWLGWVNVGFKPYVWSYSLNGYLYVDEAALAPGGSWVYIMN